LKRIKKHGLAKVSDQLAFHLFDRLYLRKSESAFWRSRPEYCDNSLGLNCPAYYVNNINGQHWIDLCNEIAPDIILATCSHIILKPALYNIPKLGTYIIHEGLTPEYKGLHTPLWALMKKDFQNIGYTVFKVNSKIDGGEILAQESYQLQTGENYRTWSWIGHNAIISGLENIRQHFTELEKNKYFVPLKTANRNDNYYTWMGLSNFLRLYFKNYWLKTSSQKDVKPIPTHAKYIKREAKDAVLH